MGGKKTQSLVLDPYVLTVFTLGSEIPYQLISCSDFVIDIDQLET